METDRTYVEYRGVYYAYKYENGGAWIVCEEKEGKGRRVIYDADKNTIDQSVDKFLNIQNRNEDGKQ